jgi:SHS2 domain-containing protein
MARAHLGMPLVMTSGHRTLPHTASLALDAWAPTRGECIAEALQALVESFADVRAAIPDQTVTLSFEEATDDDLLVRVLNDVIQQVEGHGRVPVDISVTESPDGPGGHADVRFAAAPLSGVEITGSAPKEVARHELYFGRAAGQWRCHVTVAT